MPPVDENGRTGPVDVVDLQVEYETEPTNVAPAEPRFSWRGEPAGRRAEQTAYRVLVARSASAIESREGRLWDSGKVESARSTNVVYDGVALESNADYYWTVRVWNGEDEPSEWAPVASFSTALGSNGEWEGEWIGYRPETGDANGYRSRWRSPGDGKEWVQVDLGENHDIERIELHPAVPFDGPKTPDGMTVSAVYSARSDDGRVTADGPAGFGFPVRYRIEAADDPGFEDARTVVDRTDRDQENPGEDPVALDVDVETRYLRITATEPYEFDPAEPPVEDWTQLKTDHAREEYNRWRTFALAALALRNDEGEDVAVGASVTASSSVEDGAWGREHLVNGRYGSETGPGSPLLRTDLKLSAPVERARAHVCTLGYGELYVNGGKVGDAVLDPGWTQYDERALYSTYDVTDSLSTGENALGLWLGRGWFSRNARDWTGFGAPRALLQLEIEYEDGRSRTVTTDSSWQAAESPILANDIYDGETYDARLERPGWAEAGFDDADWEGATVVDGPGGDLRPQRTPPIRVTETVTPEEFLDREDGPIVDFGQNLVGWVELDVEGAEEGDEVVLEHAETLLEDGSLATEDLRSADATDRYVARGEGTETYHPRFTYHGFRYAKVTGYPGELEPGDVRAKVVHTDVEPIGTFDCSDDDVSQLQENSQWGLRGNIHSVITDCPQRDERFGWTGDNHIVARSLLYNYDGSLFYEKWMDDHDDVQSDHGYVADTVPFGYGTVPEDPTWGITRVTIPWHLYRHYGDSGVLEDHYEEMRRYVDYWYSVSDEGIIPDKYGNYGDWLTFENADGRRGLPFDLFNSAFQYHTTNLFARIADALGNKADAEHYGDRADRIADAFNEEFFDSEAAEYGPGTQSSYAVPLYLGLVPDDYIEDIAAGLAEKVRSDGGKLQTGFLGTRPLINTLVDHGYEELAYHVVTQPERPGWMYMVEQGATTMWERWDSDDRIGDGMNSFNHSPFNFVSEWFYEALAGLGFDPSMADAAVEIDPAVVEDLEWVEGSLETVNGTLSSRWERTDDGLNLTIEVPWNTDATVRVPGDADEIHVTLDGDAIWDGGPTNADPDGVDTVTADGSTVTVSTGSGTYDLEVHR